ncbi:bifunctional phosphopantothenoylcysteine decarboxylase/phosphopantothenate synthase [Thermoplasmatales archaeon]|nr:bifunctional phosphopantothenoylcysteine decarboxylase/phosphopantothenate synthase [Thermoplasmatales archaeon]
METYEFAPLSGKKVVLGVTASISLYRTPDIVRELRREGADVIVGMSREATELLSPKVLEWASENRVITEISGNIEHIKLFMGQREKLVYLVSPASYNTIGKMANGLSDDVPSLFFSFALGHGVRTVISPAMHDDMLTNPINRRNIEFLESAGVTVIPPRREDDKAKLAENVMIADFINRSFYGSYLAGKRILIISGRGEEPLDPVRTISNHSTGTMGAMIAKYAFRMGASVTLIGNSEAPLPDYVEFREAHSMGQYESETSKKLSEGYDAIIVPAALPDFTSAEKSTTKIADSEDLTVRLHKLPKLIETIRKNYGGIIVAFRLFHEDDTDSHFSAAKPDITVYNAIGDGKTPFGKGKGTYSIKYGPGKVDFPDRNKAELAHELLKIVAEKLKGGK